MELKLGNYYRLRNGQVIFITEQRKYAFENKKPSTKTILIGVFRGTQIATYAYDDQPNGWKIYMNSDQPHPEDVMEDLGTDYVA